MVCEWVGNGCVRGWEMVCEGWEMVCEWVGNGV